jgi:hypothetical protein
MAETARKVYVPVTVKYDRDGFIRPLTITWEDGSVYEVAQVKDVRRAASLKAGGAGMRYTCVIGNKETYLFLEENRWFVEARK